MISIRTLSRDMLLGGVFAVLILYLFLRSWRSTLVMSLANPVPHPLHRASRRRAARTLRDIGHIMNDIRKALGDQLKLPAGYTIEYGGESEQMSDAFKKLEGALVLAVILVYMVMAAQFESCFQRPILMTAGATVLGVVPASLGLGEGAEIQAPLATVVLFGLTFSTVITLVLIPVVYLSLDSWLERRQARR